MSELHAKMTKIKRKSCLKNKSKSEINIKFVTNNYRRVTESSLVANV